MIFFLDIFQLFLLFKTEKKKKKKKGTGEHFKQVQYRHVQYLFAYLDDSREQNYNMMPANAFTPLAEN